MFEGFELKIVLDPFSILFVGKNGILKRVHCPFYVRCRSPVDSYTLNQQLIVDMVSTDRWKRIKYVIKGKSYHHSLFEILN